MNQTYRHWRDAALAGIYTPLPQDRIDKMFSDTCRYGSGNGWTGTSGVLTGYVRELLRERAYLLLQFEGDKC